MSGIRQRVNAFVSWGWDYFGSNRSVAVLTDLMPLGSTGTTTPTTSPRSSVDLGGGPQPYSCTGSDTMIRAAASISAR